MSNKSRGQRAETALRAILQARGYLVIRSAASKVYDLVCVDEGGFVVFLEVKSVKDGHCFRVSRTRMTREQHAQMQSDQRRYGGTDVTFAYVVRFPDGEYRVYGCEREIMTQHEGFSLDEAFPVRITPNIPPIVPHESDVRANGNGGEVETADPDNAALPDPRDYAPASIAGLDHIDPDGDARDAPC